MPPARSSKTCNQCRSRKVKCAGRTGQEACANCRRLEFACSFTEPRPGIYMNSPPERRRGVRACADCRLHKSRCSGDLPSCDSCRRAGKDCVYPEPARARPSGSGAQLTHASVSSGAGPDASVYSENAGASSVSQGQSLTGGASSPPSDADASSRANRRLPLPPVREQLQLVIDFFRHVHPLPSFSFLGEVPVAQRCLDQTLNKTLLLSLCAVTALELRYAKYHPVFTRSWIKQAEETIWEQVDQPSFFHTQALLLIMHYHIGTGDFQRAFMLSALAIRGASAMRLQYERTDLSPMAQEVRRRLMWCMTSLDGRFSMGLPECEMCPYESIYLDLPCPEEEFNADHHDHSHPAPEPLDGVREGGLLAMILRQQFIRRDAVRLKRQLSTATQPAPQVEGVVANLSRALTDIRIPQYNVAELQKYAKSRWLVRYLCAQLSWRQCWLDVYRTFLLGYPEAAPRVITSAFSPAYIERATRLCLHHARANVQILADLASLHTHTMSVVSFDIAVCGYHAARIVMFISRSNAIAPSSNVTPEAASTMATQIRRLIQRLLPDSPMVEKLCVNLDAIIKLHDAGESESAQKDSDIEDEEVNQRPNKRAPRFAVSAKQHQRLGVHSILRQTRFVDDSYDVDAESSARHTSRSPFSARHAMPEHQQQELLTAAAPEQTILQSAPILQATDAPPGPGSLHVGNSPAMEAQFPFATDSLVSDAVSSWIDAFCQSNDFGINSDDNFF